MIANLVKTKEETKKKKTNNKDTWFTSGAFKDGYDFGDVTRTALGTTGDIGLNLIKGVSRAGESVGDLAAYGGAQVIDWLGAHNYAKEVRKAAAEDLTGKVFLPLDKIINKNSLLGNKSDNIINSIGQMYAQGITSNSILGAKGNIPLNIGNKTFNMPVTSVVSGASSGMSNAINKGAEDWQTWFSGLKGGLTEGISESLFGTFGIGGSDLDDAIVNTITKKMQNGLTKSLTKAGIKATGEGTEEIVSYLLDYAGNQIGDCIKDTTGLKGVDLKEEFSKEELWENFFSGALAAGIGGIPSTISEIKSNKIQKFNVNEGVSQFQNKIENNINVPGIGNIQQGETKSYSNINDAVYDYANSIKNDFKSDINIATNKSLLPIDYSKQSQTTIFSKAKEMFSKIGKSVFKNNGEDIYVSNGDIKESIAKTVRNNDQKKLIAEHLEVFNNLDKIIENGKLIAKADETKNRNNYDKWDYYATPINLNGEKYIIEFDTVYRNDDNNRKHFRLERIYPLNEAIKKQVVPTEPLDNKLSNGTRFVEQPVSDTNIPQNNTDINSYSMQKNENNTTLSKISEQAKKFFGTTEDFSKAGYIIENGEMLNFSDGYFQKEHSDIDVLTDMENYINNGAIRIGNKSDTGVLEIGKKPTNDQLYKIMDFADSISNKPLTVELRKEKNNLTLKYDNINSVKVKNDIKNFYDNDTVPSGVEILQNSKSQDNLSLVEQQEKMIKNWINNGLIDNENDPDIKKWIKGYPSIFPNGEIISKNNTQNVKLPYIEPKKDNVVTNKEHDVRVPLVYNKDIELPKLKDVKKSEIKDKITKNLRNKSYKLAKDVTKTANNFLNFDKQEKQAFKEDLERYSKKTKEELQTAKTYQEIKNIVEKYADREVNFINEELQTIKNEIRNYKIKVDDYIKSSKDYNSFRKENLGKLRLGNEGISIDSAYQELSNMYPEYFDKAVTNQFDMLEVLADFMNQSAKVTESYRLSDFEINNATNRVFDTLLNKSLTNEEITNIQAYLEDKYNIRTREMVEQELLEEINIKIEDLDVGEDINKIDLLRTDPIRVNEKVFGSKIGQKINDATINKTKHNESERIRFLNKEREEIRALGIKPGSKESAAVQKYAEKYFVNEYGERMFYGDKELAIEFPDVATQEKIKNGAEFFKDKYDTYINQINEVITSLGYDAIPKRKDYMHHFQELDSKLAKWGVPLTNLNEENLPTDINGLTDQFKPSKNYFAAAMERKGLRTVYDAVTGIDKYLEGASNLIYHTKDIQRYRALAQLIRNTYGQAHGLDNANKFTTEQFNERVEDVYKGKLSDYVAWLDEQANALAGKKGSGDRFLERMAGRKVYTVLNTAKSQVGSNMTGFNVGSSLTNFASVVQGASKTNKIALLKGTVSTFMNMVNNDGLIDKSDFLTSRFGSKQLSQKPWQKISAIGQMLMEGTDYFTSNLVWRSKYHENLSKGMSEQQAIKKADDFSARIMGDRSKGATAELFNSKTLGFFTQFQLEVNNQWSSMIHDNKMDIKNGNKTLGGVMFQFGQLACASYFFNNFMKSVMGRDVMFDPIEMFKKLLGLDDEDKEKDLVERGQEVFNDFVSQLPMGNLFTGSGRLPVSEAFTGLGTIKNYAIGQKDKFGNDITFKDVKNDVISSAFYWLLPTGYGQLKKTYRGTSMYDKRLPIAGSYTESGNLRFNADTSIGGKVKAVLFGQYSSEEAGKYVESGYKSIRKEYIEEMKALKMNSSEYRKYRSGLNANGIETTNSDKLNYINNLDVTTEQKNIMLSNVIYNEKTKKELEEINKLNMSETNKYEYFNLRIKASAINGNKDKESSEKRKEIANLLTSSKLNNKELAYLYAKCSSSKEDKLNTLNNLVTMNIPIKEFIKLDSEEFTSDYYSNGKTVSNSMKNKVIKYVNSLKLSIPQKAILIKSQYNTFNTYDKEIASYINQIKVPINEKKVLLRSIGFKNYDKDVINYIKGKYSNLKEREEKLKELGFRIINGRVYS